MSARTITLIISPLLAIEQDQAEELVKRFGNSYNPSLSTVDTNNNYSFIINIQNCIDCFRSISAKY